MKEGGHHVRSKESSEDVTNDAADTVLGKDIERVIDAENELEFGGEVAEDTADNAEDEGRPRRDEAGAGSDGDQAGDGTAAEADRAPLPLQPVVEQAPGQATDRGGDVRHDAGHDGTHVGRQGAAAVEAEPADPEEDGAQDDVGDVVGAVRQPVDLVVAGTLAEHERVGEGSSARADVNRGTTGEVEAAHLERPAVGIPGPVRDRVVHDGRPDEDENDAGKHAAAIGSGTDGESGSEGEN